MTVSSEENSDANENPALSTPPLTDIDDLLNDIAQGEGAGGFDLLSAAAAASNITPSANNKRPGAPLDETQPIRPADPRRRGPVKNDLSQIQHLKKTTKRGGQRK